MNRVRSRFRNEDMPCCSEECIPRTGTAVHASVHLLYVLRKTTLAQFSLLQVFCRYWSFDKNSHGKLVEWTGGPSGQAYDMLSHNYSLGCVVHFSVILNMPVIILIYCTDGNFQGKIVCWRFFRIPVYSISTGFILTIYKFLWCIEYKTPRVIITNWRVGHLYCNNRGVTPRNHGSLGH